jgi:hypothetical protein
MIKVILVLFVISAGKSDLIDQIDMPDYETCQAKAAEYVVETLPKHEDETYQLVTSCIIEHEPAKRAFNK